MNKTPARGKPERELENERQYRINRQESLTRDFSSEKGVKPQEYFVYFKVLQTHFWRKRSRGPQQSPTKWVWWGKEEQRRD